MVASVEARAPWGITPPAGASWGHAAPAAPAQSWPAPAPVFGGKNGGKTSEPSPNLFIGDLPPNCDDALVQKVFGAYGTVVSHRLVQPGVSGKFAALISFADVAQAQWIVDNLNGNIPQGLTEPIVARFKNKGGGKGKDAGPSPAPAPPAPVVNWGVAAPAVQSWAAPPGGCGGKDGGKTCEPSPNVFVGDLPPNCDDAMLQTVFGAYGTVVSQRLVAPGVSGKLAALVSFADVATAQWVVDNLNGNIPQGLTEPVVVRFKTQGGGKGKDAFAPAPAPPAPVVNRGAAAPAAQNWAAPPGGCGGKDGGKASEPSPNVFIGDLPPNCDDAMLTTVFGAYGSIVSHRLVAPGSSGKLAAVVSFADVATAQWVVDNLNGNIPQGLTEPIVARFKNQGPGKGKDAGAPFGPAMAPVGFGAAVGGYGGGFAAKGAPPSVGKGNINNTIFVGDLPMTIDDASLSSIFGAYGNITSFKIMPPGISGAAAVISFASPGEAQWIVENLNENIPQGLTTPVKVRFKTPKPDKGFGKGGPY